MNIAQKYRKPYQDGVLSSYAADTGADINMPAGSPVIAFGNGMVIYSEGWHGCGRAHTPWVPTDEHPFDTPGALLLLLDSPLLYEGRRWRYAWYCHLSRGFACIKDGQDPMRHVVAGMMIGRSGIGRSVAHLHFGLLEDRGQDTGQYMRPATVEQVLRTLF